MGSTEEKLDATAAIALNVVESLFVGSNSVDHSSPLLYSTIMVYTFFFLVRIFLTQQIFLDNQNCTFQVVVEKEVFQVSNFHSGGKSERRQHFEAVK